MNPRAIVLAFALAFGGAGMYLLITHAGASVAIGVLLVAMAIELGGTR